MIETQVESDVASVERAELEAVLSAELFKRAPTLARILEYLCESQLRGETFIKEYEIATQVMGRSPDFDPQQDGSVRVNLHHLRKKLKQFYETEGAQHMLRISLPTGQNLPSFVVQSPKHQTVELVAGGEHAVEPSLSLAATATAQAEHNAPAQLAEGHRKTAAAAAKRVPWYVFAVMLTAMALLGAAVTWFVLGRQAGSPARTVLSNAVLRIGCGMSHAYWDANGRVWGPDAYFRGGSTFHRPLAQVDGTQDPTVYATGREGNFSYDIPLPRSTYEVHLHFAESLFHGEGFRAMKVAINGKRVEQMLDITSDAGGFGIATGKVYTGVEPGEDGKLHLQFTGVTGAAFLNAIEIFPGNGTAMRPVRQTTATTYYFDPQGTVWTPDAWFHGGRQSTLTDLFPGLSLAGFYQYERFGNFSYSIPVPPNRTYTVTLYFQDAWFSHAPKEKSSSGKRQFDVTCNGKELVRQLDILGEASDGDFRVTKRFTGITPTSQGKLLLNFTPSQNYAMINAIVIEQEQIEAK